MMISDSPGTAGSGALGADVPGAGYLAPGTLVFDTARADDGRGASFVLSAPVEVLVARAPSEVAGVLAASSQAVAAGRWVGGMLTYEAGVALAGGDVDRGAGQALGPVPLVWLGVYDAPEPLAAWPPSGWRAPDGAPLPTWTPSLGPGDYTARHERIRALIREGDVYQVNLTFPLTARTDASLAALYAAWRAAQPVPYGAFLSVGTADAPVEIASLSPELFFRVDAPGADGSRRIVTRPMKGTTHRGATPREDDGLRRALAADPKNRAENLMIVDLLRNDLSVVCTPGSVTVPALFETEAHPTLTQMTSTVEGTLGEGADLAALFGALFPSGSITGAPKRRAIARIAGLEDAPRGAYCGAIGYAAPTGEMTFSVAIRTVTATGTGERRRLVAGVGSGVTYDSVADDEYRECLLKAAFLGKVGPAPLP